MRNSTPHRRRFKNYKMKRCPKCKRTLPLDNFWKGWWMCRDCGKLVSLRPNRLATKRAYNREYVKEHYRSPIAAARKAIGYAISAGRLEVPKTCQKCGVIPIRRDGKRAIQGHHHNGYGDKLNVIWLCQSCHRKAHLLATP